MRNTVQTSVKPAEAPALIAPDHCELSGWCTLGYRHDDVCVGPMVSLPSSWNPNLGVLKAQITLDPESNQPEIAFDAGGDDWTNLAADGLRAYTAKVRAHLPRLDAVADQFDAITGANPTVPSGAPVAEQPRRWSFTDKRSGQQLEVVCLPGCTNDHALDQAQPAYREDIGCTVTGDADTLPINTGEGPDEWEVLQTQVSMYPYSHRISERQPYAAVQVLDNHWVQGLDPDGLQFVIDTVAVQLDRMREMHARLVEARATVKGWQA